NKNMDLQDYELSGKERELAQQLCNVLKILKDATLFFSQSTLNLATVISAMDMIDRKLTTDSMTHTYEPLAIQASLGLAKKTLNCYYSMTNWSKVYQIAMVLHPQHKLSYFKEARWGAEWI
ncbi:hypothetical protein BDR05DRAFT_850307, partial [Suillus weaverae]